MSLALNEPLGGGQVPLLKHRIMEYLLQHRSGDKGHVPAAMNTYWFVEKTKASPSNVNRAMWDLQKQGLITFREAKRSGTNGHASTTVLDRVNITPQGLAWKVEPAAFGDLGTRDWSEDDWDPTFKAAVAVEDVADDLQREAINKRLREAIRLLETTRSAHPARCTCGHPVGTRLKTATHLRGCPWAQQMEAMVKTIKAQRDALIAGTVTPEQAIAAVQETEDATKGPLVLDGLTPMQALVALLRYEAPKPVHIKDANVRLGYHALSTALYSLVKKANENGVHIIRADAHLSMAPGTEDWEPPVVMRLDGKPAQIGQANRRIAPTEVYASVPANRAGQPTVADKPVSTPLLEEARASVALDHDPNEGTHYEGDGHDHKGHSPIPPPTPAYTAATVGPLIWDLIHRADRRRKVAEAVAALEAAGLEDVALQALGAIPDDTPLEAEVVALVMQLGGVRRG